uniref:Integrase catalytic domain-containing protein n=1 Tax=Anopheles minimus TaxID=112268 RepID=A0A182VT43_9DIPT
MSLNENAITETTRQLTALENAVRELLTEATAGNLDPEMTTVKESILSTLWQDGNATFKRLEALNGPSPRRKTFTDAYAKTKWALLKAPLVPCFQRWPIHGPSQDELGFPPDKLLAGKSFNIPGPVDVILGADSPTEGVTATWRLHRTSLATIIIPRAEIITARRHLGGRPNTIYSDNGRNFVGAAKELNLLREAYNNRAFQDEIVDLAAEKGTRFSFIPTRSPNFGELWEANIKVAKRLFRSAARGAHLKLVELQTLLHQISSILNSRPLTAVHANPGSIEALTPAHFLIARASFSIPATIQDDDTDGVKTRWKRVQKLAQQFWTRWRTDYLSQLLCHAKWTKRSPNAQVGQIVLVGDDNLPVGRWPIGIITKTYVGPDGIVRVADVRTNSGTYKRNVRLLAPLPMDATEEDDNDAAMVHPSNGTANATPTVQPTMNSRPSCGRTLNIDAPSDYVKPENEDDPPPACNVWDGRLRPKGGRNGYRTVGLYERLLESFDIESESELEALLAKKTREDPNLNPTLRDEKGKRMVLSLNRKRRCHKSSALLKSHGDEHVALSSSSYKSGQTTTREDPNLNPTLRDEKGKRMVLSLNRKRRCHKSSALLKSHGDEHVALSSSSYKSGQTTVSGVNGTGVGVDERSFTLDSLVGGYHSAVKPFDVQLISEEI